MRHPEVGYRGQRYLVGGFKMADDGKSGTFEVCGWTDDPTGGSLLKGIQLHPDFRNAVVKPVIRVIDYAGGWWMEAVGLDGDKLENTVSYPKDGRWQFNGDYFNPTFTPSMLESKDDPAWRRHYFVTDGVADFLGDCADKTIAGKKLPLNDLTIRAWANGQGEPA